MFLLAAAGGALAEDLQDRRAYWRERAVPGAVVNGVDLGGMTRAEALTAVEGAVAPWLDRKVTLRAGERTWRTSLRTLGADHDAAALVTAAVDASRGLSWRRLAEVAWRGGTVPFSGSVRIETPRDEARRAVEFIAKQLHVPARDAQLRYDASRVWVEPEQPGRRVLVGPTLDRLVAALEGDAEPVVDVVTEAIAPERTSDAYRQVLFLRQRDHRLDVYRDGQVIRTFRVAVGTAGYRTPTGVYSVTQKRYRPTWINPSPDGWGRDMPARIGPGPDNPLGLRALNWSAPGAIRFHGTAAAGSIGTDASHGCVRLTNRDVVELYDLVDEGAVIVSIR